MKGIVFSCRERNKDSFFFLMKSHSEYNVLSSVHNSSFIVFFYFQGLSCY